MKLTACIYVIIQFHWTSAASIVEGKEFLISTPSMKVPFNNVTGYPRLVLTLMSSFTETVKVVTKGLTNTKNYLEKELGLKPFKPVKFHNKTLFFGPDQESGIRWTYHLTCDNPFVVMVSMETDMYVAETFMAVPVAGWGTHYFVTTLDKQTSVVLIAGEFGNVMTFGLKGRFDIMNGVQHLQWTEINVDLQKYQSYSVDSCGENGLSARTGSFIYGRLPFGVVTGNCNGFTQIRKCDTTEDSTLMDGLTGSTVAEMLLPEASLGRYFVMFPMTGRSSPGYVIVMSTFDFNAVAFTDKWSKDLHYVIMMSRGDSIMRSAEFSTVLTSSPSYVMYVQNSSCQGTREGDPSLLMLIPIELFYFMYKCIVPDTKMRHFISLVINAEFQDSVQAMYFEGENPIIGLATPNSKDLTFSFFGTFNVIEYEVKRGVGFTLYSLKSRFGCYVHGVGANATYMHPAGFISSNINSKFCFNSESMMKKGDLLDNDCDGDVDEERDNGRDDDLLRHLETNPIDEDLGFYFEEGETIDAIFTSVPANMRQLRLIAYRKDFVPPTTTTPATTTAEVNIDNMVAESQVDFSRWTEWECLNNCNSRNQQRTRSCLRKSSQEGCTATSTETRDWDCYLRACPLDCPKKTYGVRCENSCPFCSDDCNKFNGSCSQCYPGFEYPSTGCKIDVDRYLPWSEWKCTAECGEPFMVRERMARNRVDRCKGMRFTGCLMTIVDVTPGDCNTENTCNKPVGVVEGKEFLISTPSMKFPLNKDTGYPRLVLTIMSSFSVMVNVVTEGLKDTIDYLEKTLTIQPLRSLKFYDEKLFFGPDLQSGLRWTYHLSGDNPFVVMVTMETDMFIAETFMAIPVSGWGSHYFVTTLDKHFSIVLIIGEIDNVLTFTFKAQQTQFTFLANGKERAQGSEFKLELLKYQSYSVDNCGKNGIGTLTGSSVEGIYAFGVVAGNCNGYTLIRKCKSNADSPLLDGLTGSTVAEMLLPVEGLGRYFILFPMTGRSDHGYVIVVTSEDLTTVIFKDDWHEGNPETSRKLMTKGDSFTHSAEFTAIHSSKPVYVTYVQNSSCYWTSEGDPSIMMLVPIELFYFIYKCMVPDTTMRHFITLVINTEFPGSVQAMYFEGEDPILGLATPKSKNINFYLFSWNYYIVEYEVKRGVSFTLYSTRSTFGCYVHGVSPYGTYMHPAGFISSEINPHYCVNSEKRMKKGDLLDNDCDGKVDEEKENGKNDDSFFHIELNPIDEDLGFFFAEGDTVSSILANVPDNMIQHSLSTFGMDYITPAQVFSTRPMKSTTTDYKSENYDLEVHFSEWTEWECLSDCGLSEQQRTRLCLRLSSQEGCTGPSIQTRPWDCYTKSCPLECPEKTFGIDCEKSCLNCRDDCDKFNGSCSECLPEFENPETGCKIEAGRYQQWTEWTCTVECGKPFMFRERKPRMEVDLCIGRTTNCLATYIEVKPGECHVGDICTKHCKDFTWGPECQYSCINCEQPCDKVTGKCQNCRGGFMDENSACSTPCGVNQWGPGCVFNCTARCGEGQDCFDRVHGDCFPKSSPNIVNYVLIAMVIIVIGAIPIFVFIAMKKQKTTQLGPPPSEASAISLKDAKTNKTKSKLSILSVLSRSPSIKSVAKESDMQPTDEKTSSVALSQAPHEHSV